jgi:cytochrome oxidase Cu insertion factor (SCO1/SenC/PrrC family)
MVNNWMCAGLTLGALLPGMAFAQPQAVSAGGRRDARGAASGMMRQFDEQSPPVGARLPEIAAFDHEGEPFSLEQLKGSYTVLVFGCLT